MSQYIVRFSFIVLATLLNACGSRGDQPTPSIKEQKKSALQAEIKELETQRKALISTMIKDWEKNSGGSSWDDTNKLFQSGDIEEILKGLTKGWSEGQMQKALKEAENTKEGEYNFPLLIKFVLEKNVYKMYEVFFSHLYLDKTTKIEVKKLFKELTEQKILLQWEKKELQLLTNWYKVEPILELEQTKREELKKL